MTLTREEILAIEPDEELDRLIDEIIYEREVIKFPMGLCYHDGVSWRASKDYSTDISAAWEVLEQFKQYTVMKAAGWAEEYDCRIWVGITGDQWSVQAKTAPEAICKAALLAVLKL